MHVAGQARRRGNIQVKIKTNMGKPFGQATAICDVVAIFILEKRMHKRRLAVNIPTGEIVKLKGELRGCYGHTPATGRGVKNSPAFLPDASANCRSRYS